MCCDNMCKIILSEIVLRLLLLLVLIKPVKCTGCPVGYTLHSFYPNKCYYVNDMKLIYSDAEVQCTSLGNGMLVNPYNKAIHNFIKDALAIGDTYFIGMHEIAPQLFHWSDGYVYSTTDSISIFHSSAVDNHQQLDCVHYVHDGNQWVWDLGQCTTERRSICEYTIPYLGGLELAMVDGDGHLTGRVEVYHNNRWGTIMHAAPDTSGLGPVVCTAFGLEYVGTATSSTIDDGSGKIWLDSIMCPLNATYIDDCIDNSTSWSHVSTAANHFFDYRVICKEMETSYLGVTSSTTVTNCPTTITETTTHFITVQNTFIAATPVQQTDSLISGSAHTFAESLYPSPSDVIDTSSLVQNSEDVETLFSSLLIITPTYSIKPASVDLAASIAATDSVSPVTSHPHVIVPTTKDFKKKNSAMYSTKTVYDHRPSSVALGSLGLIIFVSVISFAIFLDLMTIHKEPSLLHDPVHKRRHHPKRQTDTEDISHYKVCERSDVEQYESPYPLYGIPPKPVYAPDNETSDFSSPSFTLNHMHAIPTEFDRQYTPSPLRVPVDVHSDDLELSICKSTYPSPSTSTRSHSSHTPHTYSPNSLSICHDVPSAARYDPQLRSRLWEDDDADDYPIVVRSDAKFRNRTLEGDRASSELAATPPRKVLYDGY